MKGTNFGKSEVALHILCCKVLVELLLPRYTETAGYDNMLQELIRLDGKWEIVARAQ